MGAVEARFPSLLKGSYHLMRSVDRGANAEVLALVRRVKRKTTLLLSDNEAVQLVYAARAVAHLRTQIAEVGVYRGGSAMLLCEAKGDSALLLFDSFEGLPRLSVDDEEFFAGQYRSSHQHVKDLLAAYPGVRIVAGFVPDSFDEFRDEIFSLVHIDLDLYEGTLAALQFFLPRLHPAGMIVCHDYPTKQGVRKAVDEQIMDSQCAILRTVGSQCLLLPTRDCAAAR